MSFEIRTIEIFDRQAKRLAKHYASFRDDFKTLLEELQKKPMAGTDLSYEGTLLLLSIYDKSEQSTISDKEIKRLKRLAEEREII